DPPGSVLGQVLRRFYADSAFVYTPSEPRPCPPGELAAGPVSRDAGLCSRSHHERRGNGVPRFCGAAAVFHRSGAVIERGEAEWPATPGGDAERGCSGAGGRI